MEMSEWQYQRLLSIVARSIIRQRKEKSEWRRSPKNEGNEMQGVRRADTVYQNA